MSYHMLFQPYYAKLRETVPDGAIGIGFITPELADNMVKAGLAVVVDSSALALAARGSWKPNDEMNINPSETNTVCVVLSMA